MRKEIKGGSTSLKIMGRECECECVLEREVMVTPLFIDMRYVGLSLILCF